MIVLPVLDLLEGVVVRGIAGRRNEYRPVESVLAADSRPLSVARAFRERLGFDELYVADLDAILYDRPSVAVLRELVADGFRLHVDAGLRDTRRARELLALGTHSVVAALETLPGPRGLRDIVAACGAERVIFSLDLHSGKPMVGGPRTKPSLGADAASATSAIPLRGERHGWNTRDPLELASQAAAAGVRRTIVLDLAGIGIDGGVTTLPLCRELRQRHPEWEILTGGGVRDASDLHAAREAGVDAVLIASALHDGRIAREDVRAAIGPAT